MTSQPCHPEGESFHSLENGKMESKAPMIISEAAIYFSTRIKSPLDAFTATFSL